MSSLGLPALRPARSEKSETGEALGQQLDYEQKIRVDQYSFSPLLHHSSFRVPGASMYLGPQDATNGSSRSCSAAHALVLQELRQLFLHVDKIRQNLGDRIDLVASALEKIIKVLDTVFCKVGFDIFYFYCRILGKDYLI